MRKYGLEERIIRSEAPVRMPKTIRWHDGAQWHRAKTNRRFWDYTVGTARYDVRMGLSDLTVQQLSVGRYGFWFSEVMRKLRDDFWEQITGSRPPHE